MESSYHGDGGLGHQKVTSMNSLTYIDGTSTHQVPETKRSTIVTVTRIVSQEFYLLSMYSPASTRYSKQVTTLKRSARLGPAPPRSIEDSYCSALPSKFGHLRSYTHAHPRLAPWIVPWRFQ